MLWQRCYLASCAQAIELLSITGAPYDTMQTVIGHENPSSGSLKEFGVSYAEVAMKEGKVDLPAVKAEINDRTKMVLIQRSRGYSMRDPLSIEIEEICRCVKSGKSRLYLLC